MRCTIFGNIRDIMMFPVVFCAVGSSSHHSDSPTGGHSVNSCCGDHDSSPSHGSVGSHDSGGGHSCDGHSCGGSSCSSCNSCGGGSGD